MSARILIFDPHVVPALINLAYLFRIQGRKANGERALAQALQVVPNSAEALNTLSLCRGRHVENARLPAT